MRKSILSLLSFSILAALSSACSPSMLKFTELTPRVTPPIVGDARITNDGPNVPLSKPNAQ